MFRSSLVIATALSITTGCGRQTEGDGVAPPADSSGGIEGRWVVQPVTVNGVEPLGHPIRVSIADGRIRATAQCIWFDWDYTAVGEMIEVVEHRFTPTPDQAYPPPMCARGLHPQEKRFADVILAARTARRMHDGRLMVDGPMGEMWLTPAAGAVSPAESEWARRIR